MPMVIGGSSFSSHRKRIEYRERLWTITRALQQGFRDKGVRHRRHALRP